ncbi:MAG: hypothetical protein KJ052_22010 [Candidatus Hydrogenedentes bacterium]|nr:hypothetical protein [Candidatus Hydrogenedentota bacterium]
MLAILELRPGFRPRTNCSYWDYFVDGKRLADTFSIEDFIPPLGWLDAHTECHFVEMLLRKAVGDLPRNRVPLFVCPECADYGCGAFSCVVNRTAAGIEWREFGMQNDYDAELHVDEMNTSTVLTFDPTQYYNAFRSRLAIARS